MDTSRLTWYVARASGLVAWGLVVATILWGLVMATRVLRRRPRPAWLLDMHKFLGVLTLVFVGVHVTSILLDDFVHFGLADVLVPLASSWHPVAVACGIVGMYLLVAIQTTSWLRRHLSPTVWRTIHLTSYGVFAITTVHMLAAGTDVRAMLATGVAVVLGITATMLGALAWALRADAAEEERLERLDRLERLARSRRSSPRRAA
ncbi:MAG TPA: ferric reductase-like transmembrane domain-containing protein [Acidimicrobiia bacterium]|nr:ferric reductase-like transmembrane domain-containing protein [Acidimicrobiia bacterium]